MNNATIPVGYLEDAKGRLIPETMMKPIDLQRQETVKELVDAALLLQKNMKDYKAKLLGDIEAFVELSAEEYGIKMGGIKGNVTLVSFDGKYKIQRANHEPIVFDERLQIAKELIDNCIKRWAKDARPEISALVQDAFQTDKQGKINTARVLGLKRLDIKDAEWQQAMQAISDSTQTACSKTYVRLYERIGQSDEYRAISLDMAAL